MPISRTGKAFSFRFESRMPDPMWGAIPLTPLESAVLENPRLTRLAHIKQMGLAFLDFPTLTHTRLEHSMGVLHVADMIYTTLWESDRLDDAQRRKVFGGPERNDRYRQAVRLAALLHDLGHPPFSHAVELTFTRYPGLLRKAMETLEPGSREKLLFSAYSHETFTEYLIEKLFAEVGGELAPLGCDIIHDIPRLAIGKARGPLRAFNPIISGDFDADRIDYLIRDNRRSGFAIGLSLDELYMAVHLRDAGDGRYELYIDASALPFVNSVLSARQRLIRRVHLAPTGRTATQMMINCLYGILNPYDSTRLRETIVWMHEECTDYTFYQKLRANQRARREAADPAECPVEGYFVDRFEAVAHRPSRLYVWEEHTRLDFMHMHPCLRLLAHIAGSGGWSSPRDLTFNDRGTVVFAEPSAKGAQWSDLMVDYDQDPIVPGRRGAQAAAAAERSLDFIGATENRIGRGILVQGMSNLDFFVYRLDGTGLDGRGRMPGAEGLEALVKSNDENEYNRHLGGAARRAAAALAEIGRRQRTAWRTDEDGMIATEYVLLVLYALDQHVRRRWPDARDVYVYRSEYFVNKFLPGLMRPGAGTPRRAAGYFPRLFRPEKRSTAPLNQKRVFSQIQRLAAFGLILTRSNSAYHERREEDSGATRARVYSTREEIQINMWGKYYVENEIRPEQGCPELAAVLAARQEGVLAELQEMADLHGRIECSRAAAVSPNEVLGMEEQRYRAALKVHELNGCAMTFTTSQTAAPELERKS